jgi:hypothetical protein
MKTQQSISKVTQKYTKIIGNPKRERWYNLQKSINAFHCISRLKRKKHLKIPMHGEKCVFLCVDFFVPAKKPGLTV